MTFQVFMFKFVKKAASINLKDYENKEGRRKLIHQDWIVLMELTNNYP